LLWLWVGRHPPDLPPKPPRACGREVAERELTLCERPDRDFAARPPTPGRRGVLTDAILGLAAGVYTNINQQTL